MSALLFDSRLLLAALLGVAGVAKLFDRAGSRSALLDFGVPTRLARPTAIMLPLVELFTAAALVPRSSARLGALLAVILFSAFTIAIGAALVRGRRPDCHCFGKLHSSPAGWPTFGRNAGLAALAGAVFWLEPGAKASTTTERLVTLGALAGVAVVGGQGWLWFMLLRQNGRILARLQELERSTPGPHEVASVVGSPAPAFDLPTPAGGRLTLAGLLARGRPVLLVFSQANCGPCQEFVPKLADWQNDRAQGLTVAIISEGLIKTPLSVRDVGVQVGREVAEDYGVNATPAALLIDADGFISSAIAFGADAIEALVPELTPPQAEPRALVPELAEPQDEAGTRPHAGLAATGTVLAAAAAGVASMSDVLREQVRVADDPELIALRVAIRLANPRLAADSRAVQQALLSLSRANRKHASRAAVVTALRRERTDLLALRATLQSVPTHGETAVQAKQLATTSLSLLADGLERFGRAVASPVESASRILEQAAQPLEQARSLAYAANLVLGCTGTDC